MQTNSVCLNAIDYCPGGYSPIFRVFISVFLIAYVCVCSGFLSETICNIFFTFSLINELNEIFDMYSFLICMCHDLNYLKNINL